MTKYAMTVSLNVFVRVTADSETEAIEEANDAFWQIVDEDHRFLEIEVSDIEIEDES